MVSQAEGEHETFSRTKCADLEVRTGSTGRQTESEDEGIGVLGTEKGHAQPGMILPNSLSELHVTTTVTCAKFRRAYRASLLSMAHPVHEVHVRMYKYPASGSCKTSEIVDIDRKTRLTPTRHTLKSAICHAHPLHAILTTKGTSGNHLQ